MPSVLFEYRGPGFGAQEHLVQALLEHARKGLGGVGRTGAELLVGEALKAR